LEKKSKFKIQFCSTSALSRSEHGRLHLKDSLHMYMGLPQ
jgi:hypothetical protein